MCGYISPLTVTILHVCLPCFDAGFLHLPLLVFHLQQEVNDLSCVGIDPE